MGDWEWERVGTGFNMRGDTGEGCGLIPGARGGGLWAHGNNEKKYPLKVTFASRVALRRTVSACVCSMVCGLSREVVGRRGSASRY